MACVWREIFIVGRPMTDDVVARARATEGRRRDANDDESDDQRARRLVQNKK